MVDTPISKLTAAGTLIGDEATMLSQKSTAIRISAATISALASDNSFNDSGNGFVTAGFSVGDYVNVTGFTGNVANNIYSGEITALTAGKMTIGGSDGDVIVDDAAGETVVISKWVSRRSTRGWEVAGTWTYSSGVANVDFTGLAGYQDIQIIYRGITLQVSGSLALRCSVNNGSSYYAGATDYEVNDVDGVVATAGLLGLWTTNATAARSGAAMIMAAILSGVVKVINRLNRASAGIAVFVGSTSPVNAIRLIPSNGGNITGGSIIVLGRR